MMSFFEEPQVTIDFMAGLLPKEMGDEARKSYNKEMKNISLVGDKEKSNSVDDTKDSNK